MASRKCGIHEGKKNKYSSKPSFFAMSYLYIIRSVETGKYYVGHTDQPERRLSEHNNSDHKTFTSKDRPWEMVALYECALNRGEAMKIEQFVKKQKSRALIEKLIKGDALTGILAQLVRVPHARD